MRKEDTKVLQREILMESAVLNSNEIINVDLVSQGFTQNSLVNHGQFQQIWM